MIMGTNVVGLGLLFGVFGALLPFALLVVLQVWLCRRSARFGLILPILTLLLSVVLVFSLVVFQRATGSNSLVVTDETGQVIQQESWEENISGRTPIGETIAIAAVVFLVSNIPTVVFGGIWFHYKGRDDTREDLKRMQVQDLE